MRSITLRRQAWCWVIGWRIRWGRWPFPFLTRSFLRLSFIFFICADSEFNDELHPFFLHLFFCLFRLFLWGEDFAFFAFTTFSAGSLYESTDLPLSFCPASSSEFNTGEIKFNRFWFSCSESLLVLICNMSKAILKFYHTRTAKIRLFASRAKLGSLLNDRINFGKRSIRSMEILRNKILVNSRRHIFFAVIFYEFLRHFQNNIILTW